MFDNYQGVAEVAKVLECADEAPVVPLVKQATAIAYGRRQMSAAPLIPLIP